MLTNVVSGLAASRRWAKLRRLARPDRRLLLLLGILLGVAAAALAIGPVAPWRLIAWSALFLAVVTGASAVMLMAAQSSGKSPANGESESASPNPSANPPPSPT